MVMMEQRKMLIQMKNTTQGEYRFKLILSPMFEVACWSMVCCDRKGVRSLPQVISLNYTFKAIIWLIALIQNLNLNISFRVVKSKGIVGFKIFLGLVREICQQCQEILNSTHFTPIYKTLANTCFSSSPPSHAIVE